MGGQKETQRQTEPRLIKNISAQTKRQRTGAVEGSPGEPCPQAEETCARSVEEVGCSPSCRNGQNLQQDIQETQACPRGGSAD